MANIISNQQTMKQEIELHLDNPRQLEKLYRNNKAAFKQAFGAMYPEIRGTQTADFWNERLNYETDDISWGNRGEVIFIIVAALVAGCIAKLPAFLNLDEDFFYSRNIGFIVLPALMIYFAWKNGLSTVKIVLVSALTLSSLIYINALPSTPAGAPQADTIILACIHLVLFLWCVLGFAFVGDARNTIDARLRFLKYNGDVAVMTALILIAGGILSGITVGLFSLIGFPIERFYFEYIGVFGLAAAPIVATYLTQTNPQLVGKVSPVIAKIFSPLVLVMLVIYLVAMGYSGKDPYNNRDFLMMFNAMLIGVMALIFFSVAETTRSGKGGAQVWILLLLSIVTIVVNSIALSAILFRIAEWGITPNRAAVLGGNVLILINLILVTVQLFKVIWKQSPIEGVGRSIALYLPVYAVWTIIVTFLFPLIFGFK